MSLSSPASVWGSSDGIIYIAGIIIALKKLVRQVLFEHLREMEIMVVTVKMFPLHLQRLQYLRLVEIPMQISFSLPVIVLYSYD